MRFVLLAAALALAAPAGAVEREKYQVRNTADLVRVCSTDASAPDYASAIAFCHGILVGSYQFYDASRPAEGRSICSPNPTPSRAKVMNDFVAWANARPQYARSHAVDTLFRYLAETYPCKK
jgi:hypothetical protein